MIVLLRSIDSILFAFSSRPPCFTSLFFFLFPTILPIHHQSQNKLLIWIFQNGVALNLCLESSSLFFSQNALAILATRSMLSQH